MRVHFPFFLIFLLTVAQVQSQWQVDLTFGPAGETGQFAAVDSDGKLWVTDYGDPGTPGVRVFNPDTTETSFSPITQGLDENGNSANLLHPGGVATFNDTIYVVSFDNQLVMRFLKDGTALTGWKLNFGPGDLDIDSTGHVFIVHLQEAMFSVLDIHGHELKGSPFGTPGLHINRGLCVTPDGANVYIADETDDVIATWDGTFIGTDSCHFEKQADLISGVSDPTGIAYAYFVDGNLWIDSDGSNKIFITDMNGTVQEVITDLPNPRGVAFDYDHNWAYVIHFDPSVPMVTRLVNIPTLTIAQIQKTADEQAGPSPYEGQVVKTSGIVTALTPNGYYIQDAPAAWSGLFVYDQNHTPSIGDEVHLQAEVEEYYDLTELKNVDSFQVISSGNSVEPILLNSGEVSQERYEGVLVSVENAVCTNPDLGYGEWQIDDGSGPVRVSSYLYKVTPDSGFLYNVTGVLTYNYGEYKMLPRNENDVLSLGPAPPEPVDYWKVRFHFGPDHQTGQYAAIDEQGKLWVTDYGSPGNAQVLIFNPDSTMADFSPITKGLDENGTEVNLMHPGGVAYYDSIIYVISYDNKKVLRFKSDGTPLPGFALNFKPGDLDIDSQGHIFIVHKTEAMFSVFDVNGNELKGSPFGSTGWHANRGLSVTQDASKVFLADESSDVIAMWQGGIIGSDSCHYEKGADLLTGLSNPSACEIDAVERMWVSNYGANEIIICDLEGTILQRISVERPRGAAVDYDRRVAYVVHFSPYVKMISKLTPGQPNTPIAQIKTDADADFVPDHLGETFELQGIVTSINYSNTGTQYFMQDTSAGIYLFSGLTQWNFQIGDEILVKGKLTQYKGLAEIEPENIWLQSSDNTIEPLKIKLAQIGESIESELVRLDSIWLVDPEQWPAEGQNGTVYVTDGTDTVKLFIDRDSELDGWLPPPALMNMVALVAQYTTKSPPDDGYELRGRLQTDFEDLVAQLSTQTLNFGKVAINGQKTLTVTLKNVSNQALSLDSISFNTSLFSSAVTVDSVITVGDSIEIPITFAPKQELSAFDEAKIHLDVATYVVRLQGTSYQLFPLVWRIHADSVNAGWFYQQGSAENRVRDLAYNCINDHLYVPSRVGGIFIYVLDAATGDTIGKLNTQGISGGTFPVNTIACSQDGQIIVSNLAATSGSAARLYYYKNEFEQPQLIFDATFDDLGGRVGDVVAVSGKGQNLTVYWSGSGNSKIIVLKTEDGGAHWARMTDIPLPEVGAAGFGIAPVDQEGNYLFINGASNPYYIKRDGTVLFTFSDPDIPKSTHINYFEVKTINDQLRRFITLTNALQTGTHIIELLGTLGDSLCSSFTLFEAPTEPFKVHDNPEKSGMSVYNSIDHTLIELVTNNGISSYSLDVAIPDAIRDIKMVLRLNEDFETTAEGTVPTGWLQFADSVEAGNPDPAWQVSTFNPYQGEKDVYMPNYNTQSRCWLVTPAISLTTDNKLFTFMAKDDWNTANNDFGSELNVLVSTNSQNNPQDFVLLESYPESDFYDSWQQKVIDLSSINADYVYLAFMVKNFGNPDNPALGGDNWQIDNVRLVDTLTAIANDQNKLPQRYELGQNYPNPFNPTTRFTIALPKAEKVKIEIFNVLGQRVRVLFSGHLPAGTHKFTFQAQGLASGLYFYRLKAGTFVRTKKMLLMK